MSVNNPHVFKCVTECPDASSCWTFPRPFFTLQETLVNLAGLLVSLVLVPFITDNAAWVTSPSWKLTWRNTRCLSSFFSLHLYQQTDSQPLLPLHCPPSLCQLQGCAFCCHGNIKRGSPFHRTAGVPERWTDPESARGQSDRTCFYGWEWWTSCEISF